MTERLLLLYIESCKENEGAIDVSWCYRPRAYFPPTNYFFHKIGSNRHMFVLHRTDGPGHTSYSYYSNRTWYYNYIDGSCR